MADRVDVRKIVKSAMDSGLLDKTISMDDLVNKLGPDIDEVAGYVVAWDKYVVVVAKEEKLTPRITLERE